MGALIMVARIRKTVIGERPVVVGVFGLSPTHGFPLSRE